MKMNMRGITLAAVLLSASNVSFAQQGVTSVGDLPGYDEDAYFADEATYQEQVAPVAHAQGDQAENDYGYDDQPAAAENFAPVTPEALQPVAFLDGQMLRKTMNMVSPNRSSYQPHGSHCDGGCDGGCDSCGGGSLGIGKIFGCGSNTWATTEFLMWFAPDRNMPALVTTNAPGVLPTLTTPTTVFGDDIEGDMSVGFRGDYGKYITKNVGVGGRFWIMDENSDSYANSGDGTSETIGRPFFDTNTSAENSLLIAADNASGANFTGSVQAESDLNLFGAEAYARINLGSCSTHKLELIGGYTHLSIDDELRMTSRSLNRDTGDETRFNDLFETENRFDGGQLGFELSATRGRWIVRSLTKVHLGNMNQRVNIAGSSQFGPVGTNPPVLPGGALALDNQGVYERDVFAFVPEANFKLGYQFRENIAFTVGYSFLYFDNVALTGDYVNPTFDGTTNSTGGPFGSPAFQFNDSSLWVQGIDLGLVISL
ncbi:hypothetical protein Q31b_26830 [Novipirellula aureliae]|uniref:Uncharacterized protein n=1 Tax=Novipirellula aureliae TaxID=2527966 RepID=A0A5C6DYE6_9BACT|nr:BBP7 family outer membrane beta-barrel protein [Novipirellula aureliae]TWU41244.1 hypothetical protein Q31b_26830 [Novipirellula aureliae]